jgi:hypothetical protein
MENIEHKALQTYQENLAYFEKNHPELHKKITTLETAIQSGQFQEKYALEYTDKGYFDVLENESGKYLYKMNSIIHAQNMNNIIDKKRTGAVFKAFKAFRATDAQAEIIDKSELSFHNYLWASIKIINYAVKYATPETYMKKVYKTIFIGTGLGLHILGILDKLQSQVVFIYEKNLELFRLSLFVTNYGHVAQNRTLFFSILEQKEQKVFLDFLNLGNNYNLHIKHIPFDDAYPEILQQFQKYVLSQSFINYGYSPLLLRFIESPKYLVQNYNFLNVTVRHTNDVFTNKPVLLLFSGPSTSNNIAWVKENHEKFIIISALSTCKLLYKNDIKPDIIIHIDPGEKTALLFEDIDTEEYFKNVQIILAANVNENTINRFEKSQVSIIEQGTEYKKGFGRLSSPSVGEYAYALSLIFDATNIYMLGIDLALDKNTLQTHADFHFDQRQGEEKKNSASLDPQITINYIKGNFEEKIPTTGAYNLSIEQFGYFSQYYKAERQNVYNLSDGAYLEGTKPLRLDEYEWSKLPKIDKNTLFSSASDFFHKIGSNELRDEDKMALEYQLSEAKKLKKRIIKHQKTKFSDSSRYLNELSTLSWDLSDMEYKTNSNLAQVYYEFFQNILSYIFDLFNTQKLEQEKNHIVEIDKILVTQLLKIANLYITRMENFLKQ